MSKIKTGGRQKGTPNKNTSEIKDCFEQLLKKNISKLDQWIDAIAIKDPAKALDIYIKISEFILPKLARKEYSQEVKEKISIPVISWVNTKNKNI